MRLPVIQGVIKRRILLNFRVDPEVMQRELPRPLRVKLHRGSAIAGVCLIRLEQVRPRFVPRSLGVASENAAHRVAVCWEDPSGTAEGVYVKRRDTDSRLSHWAGGRLFPGEHGLATFDVTDRGDSIDLEMRTHDGLVGVGLRGHVTTSLPKASCFESLEEASAFFQAGSAGYSDSREPERLDGIRLATRSWSVTPIEVEEAHSSYFEDVRRFPKGSVVLDSALLMRDIAHEWQALPGMEVQREASCSRCVG